MTNQEKTNKENAGIDTVLKRVRVIANEMLSELDPALASRAQEIMDFRSSITQETARGSVLMSAAFLDDRLEGLLKARLVNNKTIVSQVFDFNGALGTFSSRINFSYLLGLLPVNARTDLHNIRSIRNIFAHSALPLEFEDSEVSKLCDRLKFHGVKEITAPGAKFRRSVMALLTFILQATEEAQHLEPKANYEIPDSTEAYKMVSAIYEEVTGEEYPISNQHE
ncbi:hypothetical protein [Pseudomonas sp. On1]|uniref:hypothetical protein n=1 Tax=Pseudomonas sp. On1 TaxID=3083258 RepID=UPI0029AD579B|nr:hypothetical protein [Pseudomonas sp. On1]MDX2310144.1 hypothetical protein [Pseudomonas sp. On1]